MSRLASGKRIVVTKPRPREWSRDQRLEIHPDGGLTLTLTAQSRPELLKWILSFGRDVKIISPDWLCEKVLEEMVVPKVNTHEN